MSDNASLSQRIKDFALAQGCDLVGIAPVAAFREMDYFPRWLEQGYDAEMGYLRRQLPKRLDPRQILPAAQSVIVVGVNYHTDHPLTSEVQSKTRGWISRYAWGEEYHEVIGEKLKNFHEFLEKEIGGQYEGRYYVDTGPVLDRVFAKYAGIGWFGKNTCIINQQVGSWLFLGEIITNIVLQPDTPPPDRCGTCRRCLEACPTEAILEPYVLDSNRCISYLTIEHRGAIAEDLRPAMGNHLFGCDICQDVCPWNRKAPNTDEAAFEPRPGNLAPGLEEIAVLDEPAFRARFRKSPIKRAKWRGLLRNALIAIGNSGEPALLHVVEKYVEHADVVVRETARWAATRLQKMTEDSSNPDSPAMRLVEIQMT